MRRHFLCFVFYCVFPLSLFGMVDVTDLAPLSGPSGTVVTITGNGFETGSEYTVRLGTESQTVQSISAGSLTFLVTSTTGGGVSIQEAGSEVQETGLYFEVSRSVAISVRLPRPLDPATYRVMGPGSEDLGSLADGPATGDAPMGRATLAGIVGGEGDPVLFAIVPPGAGAVEISPLSHAVATLYMAPGLNQGGGNVQESLDEIAAIPEVRAFAQYIQSVCVPGFDYINSDAYADQLTTALQAYLLSPRPTAAVPSAQAPSPGTPISGTLEARAELTEQPSLVKNLITPSIIDPASLTVSVDPPGGKHPNHYLMKVDHTAPVVKLDFSIEISRVDPNSFPGGRQTIRNADRQIDYTYLDPDPILNGYKPASLFSSAINLTEFFVTNGPEAFPGLQAGFNNLVGLTPELQELASPNNFLIPKDFVGVLAVHSYSGNIYYGTGFGQPQGDPRSQIQLLNTYDRFGRWKRAIGTNVVASVVDLVSFVLAAKDFNQPDTGDCITKIVDLVVSDMTKEGANVASAVDYPRLVLSVIKKYQEELYESLVGKVVTGTAAIFFKKGSENVSVTLKAFAAISSAGQFLERNGALFEPKHYAMERSLVVFNDPFEPRIRSFLPREGRAGDYIGISGNNFSTTEGQAQAFFCTLPGTVAQGETPQPEKRLSAPVQVAYDTFIGIDIPSNWDSVFSENDTVFLCVETATGRSTTTFSNEDPNRTFEYVGPPRLDAVLSDPYPGSFLRVTGARFHQERQGPMVVMLDGSPFDNGVIMNSSENAMTIQLPADIEPGQHSLQLKIGDLMSNLLAFNVRGFTGTDVGSQSGLQATVTMLDFANNEDGELSLGEALLILSGPGLGRPITQRPDDPPAGPGQRFESDHLSGQGVGPVFANTISIHSGLETEGVVLNMPASFAPLLAAQAGDTFDADFLTFDLGGAAFPGFDYSGVSGGHLRYFTLRNFSGPGITLRDGTMGILIEGVGLETLTGNGLTISTGAHDNTITNLRIKDASAHGIHITGDGTDSNRIRFGFGTDLPLGAATGRIESCDGYGVLVEDGARFNHIQPGTVIDNTLGGIRIQGVDTDHNILGFNSDVRFDPVNVFNNGGHGVFLGTGVDNTLVRYVTSAGNAGDGFRLEGPDCANNRLDGLETVPAFAFTMQGSDVTKADRNTGHGIHLLNGAHSNLLGEESSIFWGFGERSSITNNTLSGIVLDGADTKDNIINHLNIGDVFLNDENGQPFTPENGEHGIVLRNGANRNVVGDLNGLLDVHISSLSNGAGILIDNAHFNEVFGCQIGTVHGNPLNPGFGIGPIKWGIIIRNGASGNQIGYAGQDHFLIDPTHPFGGFYNLPFNFIGFATEAGILLEGGISTNPQGGIADPPNVIENNAIGFGQNGANAPNNVGIRITGNTGGNVIGGPTPELGNRIRGNERYGIQYLDYNLPPGTSDAARNRFSWNVIEQTGRPADVVNDPLNQLNPGIGVVFENSVGATFGESKAEPNTIRDNFQGVFIEGGSGNRIRGTEVDDTNHAGIVVHSSSSNEIGGPQASGRNRITRTGMGGAADTAGIAVSGGQANVIANNIVGSDSDLAPNLGNTGPGILLQDTRENTVGGGFVEHGNTIVGNSGPGLVVTGATSTANKIHRNLIGIGRDLLKVLPNLGGGVLFDSGAHDNLLGGQARVSIAGTSKFRKLEGGNVITGNTGWGVVVDGGIGNQLLNNTIDFNSTGPIDLRNGGNRMIVAPEGVFDGTQVTGVVDDLSITPQGSRVQVFSGFSAFDASQFLGEGSVQADGSFGVFTGSPVFNPVVTLTITASSDDSTSEIRLTRFPSATPDARSLVFSNGNLAQPSGNLLDPGSGQQGVLSLSVEARNLTAFLQKLDFVVSGSLFDDRDVSALGTVALWHDRNENGRRDDGDLVLDTFSPSGSTLKLEFEPNLPMSANEVAFLLLTIDLPEGSPSGRALAVSLEDESDAVARLSEGLATTVPVSGEIPISGPGLITADVGVAGQYLRGFPAAASASEAELDLLADPDGDGLPNVIEYALGTNPFEADGSAAFRLLPDNGYVKFEITFPTDRTEISFRVAAAYDLSNLSGGAPLLEEVSRVVDTGAGTTKVTFRTMRPIPQGLPFFGRLHVE